MSEPYEVGGEVIAWCTKCRIILNHTIVSIVDELPKKVKCNTCQGRHNYRAEPTEKDLNKPKPRAKTPKKTLYEEAMSGLKEGAILKAIKYQIAGNYRENQVINHSTFGIGIVAAVTQTNRIEVLFESGPKLLIQNH